MPRESAEPTSQRTMRFSRAVALMLGAHVDVHQISTMACGIVRRRHLVVETQATTAHDFSILLSEALAHIACYGSGHSECIITENEQTARRFQQMVDAACVYVNAPTSFTDGAQFGLGAEIGFSTQKLGPRGPMALEEMTTYKWLINGNGQTRD